MLAKARKLDIPGSDLDRIAPVLEAMERAFRPLAAEIPPEIEPAITFRLEAEDAR
jgi:hypothetical protein